MRVVDVRVVDGVADDDARHGGGHGHLVGRGCGGLARVEVGGLSGRQHWLTEGGQAARVAGVRHHGAAGLQVVAGAPGHQKVCSICNGRY